jgi:hypothetical protein
MRRACLPGLAGLLGLMLLAGGSSYGADQPTTTKKADTEKHTANKPVAPEGVAPATSEKASTPAARTHLPAHFGRLGLSAEQHQQLKAVNEKYAAQIKQLEMQLGELKAKREGELHSLLSEAQKKALAEAKSLAEKIRKERRTVGTKAMAAGEERMREVKAGFKAREEQVLKGLAKRHAEAEERAKNAKAIATTPAASKAADKTAPKDAPKEQSKTQPEKQTEKK